jgi:dolichyl-phosphate beta-glucosyltransferase
MGDFDRVKLINLQKNRGKAEAIRTGMSEAQRWRDFDYYAYLDADFSAPPESIPYLIGNAKGARLLMGSRIMFLGANIVRNNFRHYTGRIFATFASKTLRLPIYDTQCGAKVFGKEFLTIAFEEPFYTQWLFDLEIIMRIVNHFGWNYFRQNAREVPLFEWIERGGSKVKVSYMFRLPFDLWKIRRKYGKVKE